MGGVDTVGYCIKDAMLSVPVGTEENSPAFQGWVCVYSLPRSL
jgi:hypothetical protein